MNRAGQWIGRIKDKNGIGFAVLSVEADRLGKAFACVLQAGGVPSSRTDLDYQVNGDSFKAVSSSLPLAFDAAKNQLVEAPDHTEANKFTISRSVTVEGKIDGNVLKGTWTGDSGIVGEYELKDEIAEKKKADEVLNWDAFKERITKIMEDGEGLLFRGHGSNAWPLCSSFHRVNRYDLKRFQEVTCGRLARDIGARVGHKYNLADPVDFVALLSLAQHHGFPTPLLDWTYSPYIAAYFALANVDKAAEYAKMFVFDAEGWKRRVHVAASLLNPHPTVAIIESEAFDNPRYIAQQACHTFSNVADVEAWARMLGMWDEKAYLRTIDIPMADRRRAVHELRYMGVTAGALFPGLDGTCRGLREWFYGVDAG